MLIPFHHLHHQFLRHPAFHLHKPSFARLRNRVHQLRGSPSQRTPRSPPGPNTPSQSSTATRVYGFDLNEHWQADKEHCDNQKINGLTFPRPICSSTFTQKLDIEGCDPLALPLAAPLYQQASKHWLWKLAHGKDMYLIPTGDFAAVVWWSVPGKMER